MACPSLRRFIVVLIGLVCGAGMIPSAQSCPFCSMQGQTLMGDVNQAAMVLFGTFQNAKLNPGGDGTEGSTELHIEAVLKKHEILGDKKVLVLQRYVPTDKNSKTKFLVFCDVFKGKIDPYRGVPVQADSDMVKYLTGALEVKDKEIGKRLRFYFDYLDNKEVEISNDAYKEFGNADYKDYREMAKHLPADKIAKWLQDPNTGAFRYGLYASMLGHCGNDKHAELLRKMLDNSKNISGGIEGILAGYIMLKPKEGWEYALNILKDPTKEFMLRYSALRAIRFFWDSRPDVVDKKELVQGACLLLDQSDVADLAIDDLRKWERWDVSDRVMALLNKKSHDAPIIRRAILRYALSCPQPQAVAFVNSWRKRDPETVKDVEELLKLEPSKTP
jgi:hypothetical protein